MSRLNFSEQTLSPSTSMESSKTGGHDSLQHSPKHTFKAPSAKPAAKRNARRSVRKQGARGAEEESADEGSDADEPDSSAEQDGDDDNAEEPEVLAPPDGHEPFQNSPQSIHEATPPRAGRTNGTATANMSKKRIPSSKHHKSILNATDDSSDANLCAYPRKKTSRRLSSNHGLFTYDDKSLLPQAGSGPAIDLSDDEGYAAVDFISDSEDDEHSMEKLEEMAIVDSELEDSTGAGSKAVESDDDDDDDLDEMDLAMGLSTMGADSFFAEQMDQYVDTDSMLLMKFNSPSPQANLAARKVHFADVVQASPSTSETSSDTAELPDIFMESSMSVPLIGNTSRVEEYESFNSHTNSEDGSYWDWRDDDENEDISALKGPTGPTLDLGPLPTELEDSDDAEGASSGYDTDASGDTTEEDMPPPPKVTAPRAILRSYKAPVKKSVFRPAGRPSRHFPILGSFVVDRSKAVAYRHKTKGTVVHPPKDPKDELAIFFPYSNSSNSLQSSPTTPFQAFNADDSDLSDVSRGPFSGTMDVMFSGLFGGASNQTYNFGGQVIGPPEAFYPFKSVDSSGSVFDYDDGTYDDDDDDEFEDQMDIRDFIQFGGSDDDDDDEVGMSNVETTGAEESDNFSPTSPASTAVTPFRANSIAGSDLMLTPAPSQSMLEHLDRGFVTSFRNNQDRARRLSRLPHDNSHHSLMARPIRTGRDTVITPLRKRKSSHGNSIDMKMNGDGAFSSKIKKVKRGSPKKPMLPPRGFFA